MSNPLDENTMKGTIGELLVLLRFLFYNVQACFPLKDSGNDLIAIYGDSKKTIQVKTDTWSVPNTEKIYNILALVKLSGKKLDEAKIYLLSKEEAENQKRNIRAGALSDEFLISSARIDLLFSC